jgi:cell division protein FtsB
MKKKSTQSAFRGIRKGIFNKYTLTFFIFLAWLAFFDTYNFFAQAKLQKSTQKLEAEYAEILENIEVAKEEQKDLNLNQEKYGREKYYLHKDDEDVFIIEKNKK